ncbi:motility associated factor glycosyltransferase family protein [Motilimonas pumila]|uniref:DUF115 domain-containing protein n=1 Tax=Motilimonas pumila TaxID=2303987 RepID=A0A418YGQ0_9GAMM|nr:6-hydroxymethylpterin diphosphokinase MptE-like protein [Motilimonas pumila]RJG49007.1 DUF115 domain-containing protein [Motilimonas pumila]
MMIEDPIRLINLRWSNVASRLIHANSLPYTLIEQPQTSLVFEDIQLTSCYDRQSEAKLQAQQLPLECKSITIFGPAMGDLANELLSRPKLKQLNIVIMNLAVFRVALKHMFDVNWLKDERVQLSLATNNTAIPEYFLVSPAELTLVDDSAVILRDKLQLLLDHTFVSSHHDQSQQVQSDIEVNKPFIVKDLSIEALLPQYIENKSRAYIIATGPSLQEQERLLGTAESSANGIIICLDASLKFLDYLGVVPDIVISIDPKPDICFEGIKLEKYQDTALVYFPRMSPELLNNWQGPRYCAYSDGPLYDDICHQYPKTRLFSGGSVIHPAVDLAVKLNISEIILLGADFGYPTGKTHAFWPSNFVVPQPGSPGTHWVFNWAGEKITTLPNLRGYLRYLEQYIDKNPQVNFHSASSSGARIQGAKLLRNDHDK